MEPVIVLLIIFGSVGAILWKYLDNRHTEKMTMIEKGVKPGDFKVPFPTWRPNPLSNLKWGLLAVFVGLGIMTANYMHDVLDWDDSVFPAMIFVFGGLSLIVFYVIASMKAKREGQ